MVGRRTRQPARAIHPWRFSPVLRFGTDSGAAIPVVWEELTCQTSAL